MAKTTAICFFLLVAVLALTLCATAPGYAAEQSTRFGIRLVVVGPDLPIEEHPRLPNARAIHQSSTAVFHVVEGDATQVRQVMIARNPGWVWLEEPVHQQIWWAIGHTPDGRCMKVVARRVGQRNIWSLTRPYPIS